MFSRVWKPDETLALVFEIVLNKKYPCHKYFNIQQSFDRKHYICRTCHSKGIKGKLPCQAVVNNMHVDEIPRELSSIEKL